MASLVPHWYTRSGHSSGSFSFSFSCTIRSQFPAKVKNEEAKEIAERVKGALCMHGMCGAGDHACDISASKMDLLTITYDIQRPAQGIFALCMHMGHHSTIVDPLGVVGPKPNQSEAWSLVCFLLLGNMPCRKSV
jgi:hypothetical protein